MRGKLILALAYGLARWLRLSYRDAAPIEGGFFSLFIMARELFQRYERDGQLENGREIAPRVSRMSQAVVDSLATCEGNRHEWLTRAATTLRDLCKKTMNESK